MKLNFNFGNKKPSTKQLIIVSIVVSTIVATLSQCTGINEIKFWDLIDEVQRKLNSQNILNELIIKDLEKLNRRVQRDVDRSIDNYWKQTGFRPAEVDKPKYIDSAIDPTVCYTKECQSLGGEMRLCAPWISDCKKDDEQNDSLLRP